MKSTGPQGPQCLRSPLQPSTQGEWAPPSKLEEREAIPFLGSQQLHVRVAVEPRAADAWVSVKGLALETPTWKEPSRRLTGNMTSRMPVDSALQVSL